MVTEENLGIEEVEDAKYQSSAKSASGIAFGDNNHCANCSESLMHVTILTSRHNIWLGADSNVQGSAFDIKANESARETGEVARKCILNLKVIDMNTSRRNVSALMP